MKNVLSTVLFSLFSASAMAQTATTSYSIPTKIPSGAVTPAGVTLKDLKVLGDCGSKVKITVTMNNDRARSDNAKIQLWGNFAPQSAFNVPATAGNFDVSFDGDVLNCGVLKGSHRALNVYVGMGNTAAMQTSRFGTTLSVTSTVPEPLRSELKPAPDFSSLSGVQMESSCNATITLATSFGLAAGFKKTAAFIDSNALGTNTHKEVILPDNTTGASITHRVTHSTANTLKCDTNEPTNFELAMKVSVVYGSTMRKDNDLKKGLAGYGTTASLPK